MNSIDGDYYVRQMKNLKVSIPIEWLTGDSFNFYGWACGAFLARVHARVGESRDIAVVTLRKISSSRVGRRLRRLEEQDHAMLVDSITHGNTKADVETAGES